MLIRHERPPILPPWQARPRITAAGESAESGQTLKGPMLGTVLVVLLVLMLLGAIPTWPHSRNWGYGPSGGLGLVLTLLVILLLMGKI